MIRTAAATFGLLVTATVGLSGQALPGAAPEEVGVSSERLDRIGEAFRTHTDAGRLAGAVGMVVRRGRVIYSEAWGMRSIEEGDPQETDDVFRIASMTKPITSVAVMILYEEGKLALTDPVGRYLPELGDLEVARLDEAMGPDDIPTERARRPVTVQDLLRHTSGLTYGSFSNSVVDQLYRERGVLDEPTLDEMVAALGDAPLVYHPGTQWHYGLSTDVLGRLIEVVSGQSFDTFLDERLFQPLRMVDTGFVVPAEKQGRLSSIYGHTGPAGSLERVDAGAGYLGPPGRLSGGGGLFSTASDYARFAQMLLNGGELDGRRILSPTTVDLMTVDHLPEGTPTSFLAPGWGFGLGFTVKQMAGLDGMPDSVGTFYWFGVTGTSFWVDPAEELIGVFMVQIRPNRDLPFRQQFRRLVYQALVE